MSNKFYKFIDCYKLSYNYTPSTIVTIEQIKKDKTTEKEKYKYLVTLTNIINFYSFKITKLIVRHDFLEITQKMIEEIKKSVLN